MVRHVFSIGLVTDCRGWDQRNSNYRHRQHLHKQVPLNFLFCNLYEDEQEINFNFHNFVLLRFVFSFDGTMQTRFDGKGKRLLCKQFSKAPIVYDVPSEQQQQRSPGYVSVTDKVELTDPGYSAIGGFSNFCFAGVDDELVVTHWIIV